MTRGPRLITDQTRAEMKKILLEIQSGEFAREWMAENKSGGGNFDRLRAAARQHPVEEVGENVQTVQPGDLAFCMGNHRSYYRVKADQLLLVPEGLPPEIAVFARMMGVSMTTLTTTTARPPAKVLVMGLGLVGHLAAKNFLACGYNVYACDPVESRRRIAFETGIPNVLPEAPLEDPGISGRFSLVIECSGHEQALLDAANTCLLYTSPSPRDLSTSRMPSSA